MALAWFVPFHLLGPGAEPFEEFIFPAEARAASDFKTFFT